MAEHRSHRFLPQVDPRDACFPRQYFTWASAARSEVDEAITATMKTIASSKALMAAIDRLLAKI